MLSVKGIFRNGNALPLEKIEGYEDQPVIIIFLTDTKKSSDEEESWDKLYELIENCTINTGLGDLAHQHDHYLYGTPKKDE